MRARAAAENGVPGRGTGRARADWCMGCRRDCPAKRPRAARRIWCIGSLRPFCHCEAEGPKQSPARERIGEPVSPSGRADASHARHPRLIPARAGAQPSRFRRPWNTAPPRAAGWCKGFLRRARRAGGLAPPRRPARPGLRPSIGGIAACRAGSAPPFPADARGFAPATRPAVRGLTVHGELPRNPRWEGTGTGAWAPGRPGGTISPFPARALAAKRPEAMGRGQTSAPRPPDPLVPVRRFTGVWSGIHAGMGSAARGPSGTLSNRSRPPARQSPRARHREPPGRERIAGALRPFLLNPIRPAKVHGPAPMPRHRPGRRLASRSARSSALVIPWMKRCWFFCHRQRGSELVPLAGSRGAVARAHCPGILAEQSTDWGAKPASTGEPRPSAPRVCGAAAMRDSVS
jgi:hypothetical protein